MNSILSEFGKRTLFVGNVNYEFAPVCRYSGFQTQKLSEFGIGTSRYSQNEPFRYPIRFPQLPWNLRVLSLHFSLLHKFSVKFKREPTNRDVACCLISGSASGPLAHASIAVGWRPANRCNQSSERL